MKLAICDNEKIDLLHINRNTAKKMIISLKYIHTKIIKS